MSDYLFDEVQSLCSCYYPVIVPLLIYYGYRVQTMQGPERIQVYDALLSENTTADDFKSKCPHNSPFVYEADETMMRDA